MSWDLVTPDQAGQQVTAIMNSDIGFLRELQPDDIAGARALYGGESEPEALVGFLGNPRHLSSQSGIRGGLGLGV